MGSVVMEHLKDRIWALVEPSTDGYSNLIQILLSSMTEAQLRDVIKTLGGD